MDLHMIITISGIFVGMIILIYGIYSYDKLKKEDDLSDNLTDDNKEMSLKEIKAQPLEESVLSKEEVKQDSEPLVVSEEDKNDVSLDIKEVKPIEIEDSDASNIDDLVTEEQALKVSDTEEVDLTDLDDTLVFDEKTDSKEKPEKDVNDNKSAEVEDLFD